jgi:fucose 4-O-acetylase-like acetyltransferase
MPFETRLNPWRPLHPLINKPIFLLVLMSQAGALSSISYSSGTMPSPAASRLIDSPADVVRAATSRVEWVDRAKGIGISLVVFGHVWRGLIQAGRMPSTSHTFLDSLVYAFHVPLFFFLSGMFLQRSSRKPAATFFVDKVLTIAYPYALWCVVQGAVSIWISDYTNTRQTWYGLRSNMMQGGYGQFWFLNTLFFGAVLYRLLVAARLGSILIFLFSIGLYYFGPQLSAYVWYPLGSLSEFFLFIALGAVLGNRSILQSLQKLDPLWIWGIISTCFSAMMICVALNADDISKILPFIAAACGIMGTIGVAMVLTGLRVNQILSLLGRLTLPILVLHVFATAGTRIMLGYFLHIDNVAIHLILSTSSGILFPVSVALLAERFHGDFIFNGYWIPRLFGPRRHRLAAV